MHCMPILHSTVHDTACCLELMLAGSPCTAMPRVKGIGMPRKGKRRQNPEEQEQPEPVCNPDDELQLRRSTSPSSSDPPTVMATRGPSLQKVWEDWYMAREIYKIHEQA